MARAMAATMKLFVATALLCPAASALVLPSVRHTSTAAPVSHRSCAPSMGLFDAVGKAFANDDTLGKATNAGLSKEKAKREVTWKSPNGQTKKSTVVPGQSLKDIARSTGIPIKYDCQEGTCKTCEAMINRQRVKICVAKMPDKDITISYNIR